MVLTKEETIEEHRKMWNWIADKLETMEDSTIYRFGFLIKEEYLDQKYGKGNYSLDANCFLCNFINMIGADCIHCPLDWGNDGTCDDEIYPKFIELMESGFGEEAAVVAREIANLPEKKEG